MRVILFLFPLLLASCSWLPTFGERDDSTDAIIACPEEPGELLEKPERVTLTANPTQLSGSLQTGNDVAYSFKGKEGQKLSYSVSSDTVCAVVYSWNLETLDSSNLLLPSDGEYTIQLSSISGTQRFEVSMGLNTDVAVVDSPSIPATPSATTSAAEEEQDNLSETAAAEIVHSWLDAKSKIFAPPFDLELVSDLSVSNGPLYEKTAGPSGSVQWLKNEDYYYTYKSSTIDQILSYEPLSNNQFKLKVKVTEDLSLHSPKGIDRSKSGRSTGIYEFVLAKEGTTWKIYNSAEFKQ